MQKLPPNILQPVVLMLAPAASDFLLVDSDSYPRDREDASRGPSDAVLLNSGEMTTFGCD